VLNVAMLWLTKEQHVLDTYAGEQLS